MKDKDYSELNRICIYSCDKICCTVQSDVLRAMKVETVIFSTRMMILMRHNEIWRVDTVENEATMCERDIG